ncbi:hypothetical protein H4219_003005 [Mycoemilia scoparia]|uniref:Uncharacterized protein n=1 Tax=Mycoemilia scoparia TaxID=417184 RepID=A0A9W8DTB3_9FUNG|nr:hypothetical protein H4219_003005 [Mycoemilia scoparia]
MCSRTSFVKTLAALLFVLIFAVSIISTGTYAAQKVRLDQEDLPYARPWQYRFKWVVKPLSAFLSLLLLIFAAFSACKSCCGGGSSKSGRSGRVYPSFMLLFSVGMCVLWSILVAYQFKNAPNYTDNPSQFIDNSSNARFFIYPLASGISLKNDCGASPFTLYEHGELLCKLIKIDSITAIIALGLWGIALLFSLLLLGMRRSFRPKDNVIAPYPAN